MKPGPPSLENTADGQPRKGLYLISFSICGEKITKVNWLICSGGDFCLDILLHLYI